MEKKSPILVVIKDGAPCVYSADTTQDVYIIDQRGGEGQIPVAYKTKVLYDDVEQIAKAIKR